MKFKDFYSIWMFYEGNERYLRGKKGSKTVPNISPKRKLLHVLMPKTLTLFKTKIVLLIILPLVFSL